MSVKETICRFCLKILEIEPVTVDDVTRQIFEMLQIQLDLQVNKNPVMCKDCSDCIDKAFSLKSVCIDTEEIILLYYSTHENSGNVHLKNIYQVKAECTVSPVDDVCRLCLQLSKGDDLTSVDVLKSDAVFMENWKKYMNELNLDITRNPKICLHCKANVQCYFKFVSGVVAIEEKINSYRRTFGENNKQIQLSNVLNYSFTNVSECPNTLVEVYTLKKEDMTELFNTNSYDITEIKIDLDGKDIEETNSCDDKSEIKIDLDAKENGEYVSENLPGCTEFAQNYVVKQESGDTEEADIFKIEDDLDIEETKLNFEENFDLVTQLNETESSQKEETDSHFPWTKKRLFVILPKITIKKKYKCDTCDYQSNRRQHMNHHMIRHKDPSELRRYECPHCTYKTYWKGTLNYHLQKHTTERYHCEFCTYSTKYKHCLKKHTAAHKNPTEMKPSVLHKCMFCDYQTKGKSTLKEHMYKHTDKSELQMYKCYHCDYETLKKRYLTTHVRKHIPNLQKQAEAQKHECEICGFKTKYKIYLRTHMFSHMDPSQLDMYKCSHCSYQSPKKQALDRHSLVHKDPSEVKMYRCSQCSFETKRSGSLKKHRLSHDAVKHSYDKEKAKQETCLC